ncbi:MAG: NADPH-dependent 2,4-dienoyl-CoA reductase, partial [Lysobacterales bacterium]
AQGGVKGVMAQPGRSPREIWLLQRKPGKPGKGLGKTTGWTHRLTLDKRGVQMIPGVSYHRIDDAGLHIEVDGQMRVLPAEHVVICAGQVSLTTLLQPLKNQGKSVHLIGGADRAVELDAKRAIRQGAELAARI